MPFQMLLVYLVSLLPGFYLDFCSNSCVMMMSAICWDYLVWFRKKSRNLASSSSISSYYNQAMQVKLKITIYLYFTFYEIQNMQTYNYIRWNNNHNRHIHITLHRKCLKVHCLREEAACVRVDPHRGLWGAGAGVAHRAHLPVESRDYHEGSIINYCL